MVLNRMTSLLLVVALCSSQFMCATIPEEDEDPKLGNEALDEEDEVSSTTPTEMDETEEETTDAPVVVPRVLMPSNSDVVKSYDQLAAAANKTTMKPQSYYWGQVDIIPKIINNPEYDIVAVKASCSEDEMDFNIEFSSPFKGYIYPYHHFTRCHLFTGDGEKAVNFLVMKDSCGLEIVYESPKGDIAFLSFTVMIQWDREFITQWDRKLRVTCNHKGGSVQEGLPSKSNASVVHTTVSMNVETQTEDETDDGDSTNDSPYDPVQIGETVDITFTVSTKGTEEKMDAQVVQCTARDLETVDEQDISTYSTGTTTGLMTYNGKKALLVDGCPKDTAVFSAFQKETTADAIELTNTFKVFRFPSSAFVFVECDVRVCRDTCPPQQDCKSPLKTGPADDSPDHKLVKLFRPLMVRLGPLGGMSSLGEHHDHTGKPSVREGVPTASFIAGLIGMGFICAIVCVFMYKRFKKGTEKDYKMQYSPNAEKNKEEVAPLKVTSASTE